MNEETILKVLELTLEIPDIDLDYLKKITGLAHKRFLTILGNQGYIAEENGKLMPNSNFRINLAIYGIVNLNLQPAQVIKYLTWQEFEYFCLHVLERHEFHCVKNFRFTKNKKRNEIDILGFHEPHVLTIDAKRWQSRGEKKGALRVAAERQLGRARTLSTVFSKYLDRFQASYWKQAIMIPMVITSMFEDIKFYGGVPIIPFFQFNGFISNLHQIIDDLPRFKVKVRKTAVQTKLSF